MRGIWLRKVNFNDANFMYSLRIANASSFFLPPPDGIDEHKEWMKKYLHVKGAKQFYIVFRDGTQIGTISIIRKPKIKVAVVGNIIISKELRNKGYGAELIELVAKILKAEGYLYIDLEVKGSNFGAIKFYRKVGFLINRDRIPMRRGL